MTQNLLKFKDEFSEMLNQYKRIINICEEIELPTNKQIFKKTYTIVLITLLIFVFSRYLYINNFRNFQHYTIGSLIFGLLIFSPIASLIISGLLSIVIFPLNNYNKRKKFNELKPEIEEILNDVRTKLTSFYEKTNLTIDYYNDFHINKIVDIINTETVELSEAIINFNTIDFNNQVFSIASEFSNAKRKTDKLKALEKLVNKSESTKSYNNWKLVELDWQ